MHQSTGTEFRHFVRASWCGTNCHEVRHDLPFLYVVNLCHSKPRYIFVHHRISLKDIKICHQLSALEEVVSRTKMPFADYFWSSQYRVTVRDSYHQPGTVRHVNRVVLLYGTVLHRAQTLWFSNSYGAGKAWLHDGTHLLCRNNLPTAWIL